jgi:adenosylcobinamide kinase/adenosylcobinamide-phosphate guanylyltransferase
MKKIILITGGERSGKSRYAETLALQLSHNPVYLATARIWDEEFRQRVRIHRSRRGDEWTNIEEEKHLSKYNLQGRVILVDCLTLWATNYFFDNSQLPQDNTHKMTDKSELIATGIQQIENTLRLLKEEFDNFTSQDAIFIFVTNEIGMGGTPTNDVQRRFTDLLGWFNQFVAQKADEVFLMVSGIAVKIKENK